MVLAQQLGLSVTRPWVMVSFSDGEDPHFRKAYFDPDLCPSDCPRPCAPVCPTHAIGTEKNTGIKADSCYGCGRCLSLCPLNLIEEQFHQPTPHHLQNLVELGQIDAIEIHTQIGHGELFAKLWPQFQPWLAHLQLVAISCQDGPGLLAYLHRLKEIIEPMAPALLWQTDGRPMSGDLGQGTIHRAIAMGQKVTNSNLGGYVQLAGGTNNFTVPKLRSMEQPPAIAGIAYGGYARTILNPIFEQMEDHADPLEKYPLLLNQAHKLAENLVNQIKIS
jgi:Fe-S-cluster-containing hydrogenase component 2